MMLLLVDTEDFANHFLVIKVVLHALNLLIVFMSLAGNEDYVALLCHHAGCADGFLAVYDADYLLHLLGIESGKHVVDDVLWLFETWVVAGDDYLIALLYSLLCHQWALALVTVAAGTAYGDYFAALAVEYLVDGVQYVLQCIWCMGIVNDGCIAFW